MWKTEQDHRMKELNCESVTATYTKETALYDKFLLFGSRKKSFISSKKSDTNTEARV